jgi:SH3 domain protein
VRANWIAVVRPAQRIAWLVAALCVATAAARADWVDGELRVYMRSGAGLEYRILRALKSGDAVTRLGSAGEWSRVRASDGLEGFVETVYVSNEMPAELELPRAREQLAAAEKQVAELAQTLADQAQKLAELDATRARALELETENARLQGGSRWRELLTGAAIVLFGLLIGAVLPRGGAARARRLKL